MITLKRAGVTAALIAGLAVLPACGNNAKKAEREESDINISVAAVQILSSDDFGGREAGTEYGRRAGDEIIRLIGNFSEFEADRQAFNFTVEREDEARNGTNIIVTIPGRKKDKAGTGPVLVATAHYDHLGTRGLDIYNGADDNASGVGGLFKLMRNFKDTPPKHTVMLVWLDAEEYDLQGAQAFVRDYAPIAGRPLVNLNLDMIAQSQNGELYMAGSYHTPSLKPLVQKAAKGSGVTVKFGNDRPQDGENDWTNQSDHGVFHNAGVPFVYFGVEDHDHYHAPTDEFDTLPIEFYRESLKVVVKTARALDAALPKLARPVTP